MADFDRIEVSATLNIPDATSQIKADLKTIEASLSPININAKINTDTIKNQTAQVQSQINSVTSQVKTIPVNIDSANIKTFIEQLKNLNVGDSSIDDLVSKMQDLNMQVLKVSASYQTLADGTKALSSIRINGVDQLGQSVTDIEKFNSESGKFVNSTTQINNTIGKIGSTTKSTSTNTQDLTSQLTILGNRAEGSYGSLQKYLNQNSQVAKKLPNQVSAIKDTYTELQSAIEAGNLDSAKQSLQQMNSQVTALRGEARELNIEGRTFGETLRNDIGKFAQWISASTLLIGAFHEIKNGIGIVNSLNKSMTDIQMITGMSSSQVGNLTKQYSDLASQLHETTTSIMSASEEFLRAGNSADETASLLKASTVMSKIAGQSQEESAQSLISIMNAYHMKADDMMSVTDKLVAVDNTSATSTAELSEAIQKTAASAQSSGVSFSQLVSWIGEVSSVSRQSADTIGTAFNSIFSRYEKVKAGAKTDDQGEAVNDVEKVLKKFNISIRDQSNNFINFNTVLTEVAQKWSTLNTVEQGQISTAIAGLKVA